MRHRDEEDEQRRLGLQRGDPERLGQLRRDAEDGDQAVAVLAAAAGLPQARIEAARLASRHDLAATGWLLEPSDGLEDLLASLRGALVVVLAPWEAVLGRDPGPHAVVATLVTLTVASMLVGTIMALRQTEVVRLLDSSGDDLTARVGEPLELAGIAVRRLGRARDLPVDDALFTTDAASLVARDDVDLVIEVDGRPMRALALPERLGLEVGETWAPEDDA